MSTSIVAFIIVLGVLVFFHEIGHFLVARLCGVGVEIFSLGFGPRIVGKTVGRTDYRISAIPLGGFVKMVGEEPDADIDPADMPLSFTHKSVYKRILIVAAGPMFNLILALLIFFGIFLVSGTYVLEPVVGSVAEGAPAQVSGLREGDRITAIDGRPIATWEEMAEAITKSRGKALSVSFQRGDEGRTVTITPQTTTMKNFFGEETERYIIGITSGGVVHQRDLTPGQAVVESFAKTYEITRLTVLSIVKLIQGVVSTKTLGGPIMIAQMAGEQAREGATNLVFFIALLSINLGILNFLPIPVLDGGHLVFFFIEAVTGKPVNRRVREVAQQAGIFVLLLLMIFVFYNDLSRIFATS
ncbi:MULTISPECIES: RIP metalloprotease RseP [Desulfococcus]|jgi:regulator of sigma E protease|uniref:Zinc metalloprotease n=1 Tax=Desulfococcus multivorans DSM 2059 TaxID=1121405 RepID=S7V4A0_DESML|nr:RIP metalloprotease RseP [Desulfococcus multivorans]AOY58041.1 RseP: predicted membrane-associated zinc metallprotease [Desulfococcus multivorans]AQV00403.1 RIP metalloprotease RseP [Desulfococcus multivorans]EPR41389.1 membrane-associated zinc metalloprotease [Desulfococcus multivorans DSM 2059]MDX9817586.1 RIP metalloprotease RseP [Desulfococcus multivorans]SJZ70977.1 site-2 protease. Metallo peptidase. MEROPS family M50B [Desulfococcus multivorans DSM 2059]